MYRRIGRWITVVVSLGTAGAASVVLTFFLVSQQPEGKQISASGAISDPTMPFGLRLGRWLDTVLGSGFTRWGGSPTAPDVAGLLAARLPVSATVGLTSWVIGWVGGLLLAVLLCRSQRWSGWIVDRAYPFVQAVPALTIVFLGYTLLVSLAPGGVESLGMPVGIGILGGLLLLPATALWLNALRRELDKEHVRASRSRGLRGRALWTRSILPNAIASSGVLTQAAFSLAGLVVGSLFVEKVFSLGGVATEFLQSIQQGQAELAATAVVIYFVPLAVGVSVAEGVVLLLQPEQGGRDEQ